MNLDKTTAARTIPPGLAEIVEALELEQPRVITTPEIGELARRYGIKSGASEVVRRLRKRGWLLPSAVRGAWEFVPGSRAGRFTSGDPHAAFRGALALNPTFPGQLAYESAAWLLGLSSRQPVRHVISLPPSSRTPSLASEYRVVRARPKLPTKIIDGLPVWTIESLLVGMAQHPTSFRDWPNVLEWLPQAVASVDPAKLARELDGQPRSVSTRTAYLLERGGASSDLLKQPAFALPSDPPLVYFGSRARPGHYVRKYNLRDAVLSA